MWVSEAVLNVRRRVGWCPGVVPHRLEERERLTTVLHSYLLLSIEITDGISYICPALYGMGGVKVVISAREMVLSLRVRDGLCHEGARAMWIL